MTDEQLEVLVSIDIDELCEHVRDEGFFVYADEPSLHDYDDSELQEELWLRDISHGTEMDDVFEDVAMIDWLRAANPPQAIRDAFWSAYGRIL